MDSCECLGDVSPAQSLAILDTVCSGVQFLPDQYVTELHNDNVTVGMVVVPNKTRCGVKSADYPSVQDTCYCSDVEKAGVRGGFWQVLEVLSLPWKEDLWWPNSTAFKVAKLDIEQRLDRMYLHNTVIFGHGYVRSVVMKMLKGSYELHNLTPPNVTESREWSPDRTEAPAVEEGEEEAALVEYVYDDIVEEWARRVIHARGGPRHPAGVFSTLVWVEHQFVGEFTVQNFDKDDFLKEHMKILHARDGQWMKDGDNETMEFWLSQGCYMGGTCLVRG